MRWTARKLPFFHLATIKKWFKKWFSLKMPRFLTALDSINLMKMKGLDTTVPFVARQTTSALT
jgi:hypothetical protein